MVDIPAWAWVATIGLVLALFVLDFVVAVRKPHAVHFREATFWSVFYIAVALLFGLAVWMLVGHQAGTEYFAGYIVEKSLSVDNLFVFVIIMARFSVPAEYQQRVLLFGIAAALILRVILIMVGAAFINLFSFTFLIFGLILIWTAVQLVRHRNEEPDVEDTLVVRQARKIMPMTTDYHGGRMFAHENGQRVMTPLLIVFVAIGSTDLLFALDSIPAVYGVTKSAFIVFSANAFALLGLRALYFLIEGLLDRLVYLSIGLSAILAFIGAKLILQFLHEDVSHSIPHIATPISLAVIITILIVTTVASLMRVKEHPEEKAKPGSLRKTRKREEEPSESQS
ncbi:TerC family protein [Actinomadura sp. WMMB 499]|uniref:TerC family protein n=1 Tax=Actinomadura sp. WMMB 499 TaxID=1219491 RepID=UPI001248D176|nr:TerC family protein [Actinomadura sp. WMMB 499]QFG22024.1 TerC family protein [Actinomadura sp. WMMB 499]